jgi:hypothetical protein
MEKTVNGRREYDSYGGNKNHTTEKGIERGKNLADIGRNIYDRAHAAQDHAGIVYRIDPGNTRCIMISQHTNQQADSHYQNAEEETFYNPPPEYIRGCQGLVFGFIKHDL